MFSKLTMSLAVMMSLTLASNAFAETKAEAKKAEEAKVEAAKAEAAKKLEAEKAEETKRAEEAKLAAEKAKNNTGFAGYMKSHFSASYHGEYYFQRRVDIYNDRVANHVTANEDDKKIQDMKVMHIPTVIYRPVTNFKILVTSEFKYTDANPSVPAADGSGANASTAGTYINRHYRSLILLTQENVLTEKDNGVKLDLSVGRRVFDRNHGKASNYGNSRVNGSLSKKFNDKLSSSMLVQYLANDPVQRKIAPTTWKHSIELIPSFTLQITDKLSYFFNDDFILNSPWTTNDKHNLDFSHEMNIGVFTYAFNDKNSVYLQLKYLHASDAPFQDTPGVNDWFEYYIGYTFALTPKISFTPEIGSELFRGADGRDFFAQKVKYPELALYVDIAL